MRCRERLSAVGAQCPHHSFFLNLSHLKGLLPESFAKCVYCVALGHMTFGVERNVVWGGRCASCVSRHSTLSLNRESGPRSASRSISPEMSCVFFLAFMSYDTLVQQCPHHHTTPLPLAHGTLQETVRGYEPPRSPDSVRVFNKEHETFELPHDA